jgi:hypothetical protein
VGNAQNRIDYFEYKKAGRDEGEAAALKSYVGVNGYVGTPRQRTSQISFTASLIDHDDERSEFARARRE